MKIFTSLVLFGLFVNIPNDANAQVNQWSSNDISELLNWMAAAPTDALPKVSTVQIEAAIASKDQRQINAVADEAAMDLARKHLLGFTNQENRAGWEIKSEDESYDLFGSLQMALQNNHVESFFQNLRPQHPIYQALHKAYATENDATKRANLALNMERWRWMPLKIGSQYLIVNIPRYEVSFWQDGVQKQSWPVIVGEIKTPTPIFNATVTGTTFNPWWEIPQSIVKESVGALLRQSPAHAKRRGYVLQDGHYRQRPGASNSLGLVKLVMLNSYSVFLHDTPNKKLFAEKTRAFSHGCIRVGKALDFAATLLKETGKTVNVDQIISKGETQTISLGSPLPLYIVYLTADMNSEGSVSFYSDVYAHDKRTDKLLANRSHVPYDNS